MPGIDLAELEKAIDDYNAMSGYDQDGPPTALLASIGMDDVLEELDSRSTHEIGLR
jgi:hypothetical protein